VRPRELAVLALAFALTLPVVTTRIYASDEIQYFSWIRSIAFDHDADFQNEYQRFWDEGVAHDAGFHETFLELTNENGRRINFAPIGTAILWTPFFAAGHLVALATHQPADGFSHPYIAAVTYGSAVYGFLAVLLTIGIVRRIVGHGTAATIAIWAGTPFVFYMYIAPAFSHACSAFAVSLMLWLWLRCRDTWRGGQVFGLALAGALLPTVREQDVIFLVIPALDFLRWTWRRRATGAVDPISTLKTAAIAVVGFLLGYAPQLAAYQALNGHPGATRLVMRKMVWTAPHFWPVLFSTEHGFFWWTPLAILGIAGLVLLTAGRARVTSTDAAWIGALALLAVLLQVYVSGAVESWTVAGSFGQRRFVALTPLLALGLAALGTRAVRPIPRTLFVAAVVAGVWWNLGLAFEFGAHLMDRQNAYLPATATTTFITLPAEAPALAWRYLTNRSSFYGGPHQ
jgi:hypothetical protein